MDEGSERLREARTRRLRGNEELDAGRERDERTDVRPPQKQSGERVPDPRNPERKPGPAWLHSLGFQIGAAVAIVLAVGLGIWFYLYEQQFESTTDAFIDAHIVHVSPQIAGQIVEIAVNDNQLVRHGQLLVEIDPKSERDELSQAQARLAAAETQVGQARATEEGDAAQAGVAQSNLARYRYLEKIAPTAVAQQQIDQAVAADKSAVAQEDAAEAQIKTALAQINVDRADVATANLNLGYTTIVAPMDGHVTQRSVALGDYVTPGEQLLAIVPANLWVTANFKETQLAHMRPGQSASVSIDACGGQTVKAHVNSIQRGAGQAFQILPPENATGNFVKVVQRVPVKIVLDSLPKNCVLGPGMSVEPVVTVR